MPAGVGSVRLRNRALVYDTGWSDPVDYGAFQPIQIAAAHALQAGQECVAETRETYRSRAAALIEGLQGAGWNVAAPRATMFIWARIPEPFAGMPSVEFARMLLREAGVVVSPGVGFGAQGEGCVRFALIEPDDRLREAGVRIGRVLRRAQAAA